MMYAYVGCRTTKERNARGEGLKTYAIEASGEWRELQCLVTEPNPSYQTLDREGKFLYSVHGDFTKASSYKILPDHTLEHINTIDIGGRNPVDITVDKENRRVIVATLQGGTLYSIERNWDGSLGKIVSAFTYEGKEPGKVSTIHQCIWDRSMDYLFAAAQGRVNGYGQFRALKYDKETGAFAETSRFMARTWDEPRHAAVHPNNRWVYLCEEKGNKVLYFQFDHERGALEALQELSIAVYRIDRTTGYLKNVGFYPCLGKTPRFFCFAPNGRCYVANEDSDTIIEFDFDSSGRLVPTLNVVRTGSPVCIVFTQD